MPEKSLFEQAEAAWNAPQGKKYALAFMLYERVNEAELTSAEKERRLENMKSFTEALDYTEAARDAFYYFQDMTQARKMTAEASRRMPDYEPLKEIIATLHEWENLFGQMENAAKSRHWKNAIKLSSDVLRRFPANKKANTVQRMAMDAMALEQIRARMNSIQARMDSIIDNLKAWSADPGLPRDLYSLAEDLSNILVDVKKELLAVADIDQKRITDGFIPLNKEPQLEKAYLALGDAGAQIIDNVAQRAIFAVYRLVDETEFGKAETFIRGANEKGYENLSIKQWYEKARIPMPKLTHCGTDNNVRQRLESFIDFVKSVHADGEDGNKTVHLDPKMLLHEALLLYVRAMKGAYETIQLELRTKEEKKDWAEALSLAQKLPLFLDSRRIEPYIKRCEAKKRDAEIKKKSLTRYIDERMLREARKLLEEAKRAAVLKDNEIKNFANEITRIATRRSKLGFVAVGIIVTLAAGIAAFILGWSHFNPPI